MNSSKISKKLAVLFAFVLAFAAAGVAAANIIAQQTASAADLRAITVTTIMTEDATPSGALKGAPESFTVAPSDEVVESGKDYSIPVNPDKISPANIYVDIDWDASGNGDARYHHIIHMPIAPSDDTLMPIEYYNIERGAESETSPDPEPVLINGKAAFVKGKDFHLTAEGVLDMNSTYDIFDESGALLETRNISSATNVEIYAYMQSNAQLASYQVYGYLTVNGSPVRTDVGGGTVSFDLDGSRVQADWIGNSNTDDFNAIFPTMDSIGKSKDSPLQYNVKSIKVYTITPKNKYPNIYNLFELQPFADSSEDEAGDGTTTDLGAYSFDMLTNDIFLSDKILASKVLIVVDAEKNDSISRPSILKKTTDSFTTYIPEGYTLELWDKIKDDNGKKQWKKLKSFDSSYADNKTGKYTLTDGKDGVKISPKSDDDKDGSKDGVYWVRYVDANDKASKRKKVVIPTELDGNPFAPVTSGQVKDKSCYVNVTIKSHFGQVGNTHFNYTINSVNTDMGGSAAVQDIVNRFFKGTTQTGHCIDHGKGYSDGYSGIAKFTIYSLNESKGTIKGWCEVMEDSRFGKSIQRASGPIHFEKKPKGRIAIQKAANLTIYDDNGEIIGNKLMNGNKSILTGSDTHRNDRYNWDEATFKVFKDADVVKDVDGNAKLNSDKTLMIRDGAHSVDTIEVDEDGYGESNDLASGTYWIVEVPFSHGDSNDLPGFRWLEGGQKIKVSSGEESKWTCEEPTITGTVKIKKHSTDPNSEKNPYYNFEGIVYRLEGASPGYNYDKSTYIKDLECTLNAEGEGIITNVPLGEYNLREVSSNKWYQENSAVYHVDVREPNDKSDPIVVIDTEDTPEYVWMDLQKMSENPEITEHNDVYDLRGAKYQITCQTKLEEGSNTNTADWLPKESQVAEGDIIETGWNKATGWKSDDRNNGYGKSVKLLYGDYQLQEIKDGVSYALDPALYDIASAKFGTDPKAIKVLKKSPAGDDHTYYVTQADKIGGTDSTEDLKDNPDLDFSLLIDKRDDMSDKNDGQGKADLTAVFEIRYYNVQNPTDSSTYDSSKPFDVWYLRTDEHGHAVFDDLLERDANGNIVKTADGKYGVGKTYEGERIEQEHREPYKYVQNPDNNGRIYIKADENGVEHAVIPVGIIEVEEVVAPAGYLYEGKNLYGRDSTSWALEDDVNTPIHKIINNEIVKDGPKSVGWEGGRYDTKRAVEPEMGVAFGVIKDHLYRGDIQLQKKRGDDSSTLAAKIPFLVTSKTTGEQHIIVTNENGYYTSQSEKVADRGSGFNHSLNTNYNDSVVDTNGDGVFSEEELSNINHEALKYDVGTYFFGYGPNRHEGWSDDLASMKGNGHPKRTAAAETEDGAFPYDDYTIQELRVPANEGLALLTRDFTVERNNSLAATFDIDDFPVRIHTTATDENGKHSGDASGETVKIYDEVYYEGLTRNTDYKMTGTLMNKATGEPLKDADGNTFVKEVIFNTGNDTQGTVRVVFEVPAELVVGKSVVVFEDCYTTGGIEMAVHHDIDDEGQTVTYTTIHTTATDSVTGDHYGQIMNETVTVVDAVYVGGLTVGKEYSISGKLMDKSTGQELRGPNGELYVANTTFTAEAVEQTVELRFEVPRSVIAGKTVVAFEDLYYEGVVIGSHADINDEDQTVYYPNVHTTATDNVTGLHVGLADENVIVNDMVEYNNLIKGAKYTIYGVLMDKATGESLKDASGKEITAEREFIAGEDESVAGAQSVVDNYKEQIAKVEQLYKENGPIEGVFNADSSEASAFEQLSKTFDSVLKEDIENSISDVYDYGTIVKDQDNGAELIYNLYGTVSDYVKALGDKAKDVQLPASTKLQEAISILAQQHTAANYKGTVEEAQQKVSAFADMVLADWQKLVENKVEGADKITAAEIEAWKTAALDGDYTLDVPNNIYDMRVSNEDMPDNSYYDIRDEAVHASFVIKSLKNFSGKEVADGAYVDGKILVSFEVPREVIEGKSTVVFEELQYHIGSAPTPDVPDEEKPEKPEVPNEGEKIPVADHKDINDEGQTVYYPNIRTLAHSDNPDAPHQAQIDFATGLVTFTDTITYSNLLVGETYVAEGVIMDKSTNKPLTDANGKQITATTEFRPETSDGTVDVVFSFDARNLGMNFDSTNPNDQQKDVVVFEEMSLKGSGTAEDLIKVAEHKDINDADQSMRIGNFDLADELVETGPLGQLGDAGIALAVLAAAYGAGFFVWRRFRSKNEVA